MEHEAVEALQRDGAAKKDVRVLKTMDIRYYGQVREQNAQVPKGKITSESLNATIDRFHEKHRKVIGYSAAKYPTEIIRLHLEGIGEVETPRLQKISQGGNDPSKAVKGMRKAFFRELNDFVDTRIYDGDKLLADNVLTGPCIVEEKMTTIVVPPYLAIKVDQYGNYRTIKHEERNQ
jgi:N-methylhydantoinase A